MDTTNLEAYYKLVAKRVHAIGIAHYCFILVSIMLAFELISLSLNDAIIFVCCGLLAYLSRKPESTFILA
jgi:hypothetical protein